MWCVAPLVGAWIETLVICCPLSSEKSHPSWVRGLKPIDIDENMQTTGRTPRGCVDWNNEYILLSARYCRSHPSWVRGLKPRNDLYYSLYITSHPSWVRGLKLSLLSTIPCKSCRTPRGCVDWNKVLPVYRVTLIVAPLVGAWIETWARALIIWAVASRTPRGCVDWNHAKGIKISRRQVAPLVGAWIETFARVSLVNKFVSHPSWVRGLKQELVIESIKAFLSHPSWVRGLKQI